MWEQGKLEAQLPRSGGMASVNWASATSLKRSCGRGSHCWLLPWPLYSDAGRMLYYYQIRHLAWLRHVLGCDVLDESASTELLKHRCRCIPFMRVISGSSILLRLCSALPGTDPSKWYCYILDAAMICNFILANGVTICGPRHSPNSMTLRALHHNAKI